MLTHRRTAALVRLTLVLLLVCGVAGLAAVARPADASAASGHLDWWYTGDSPNHELDAITAAVPGPAGSMYAGAYLGDDFSSTSDLDMLRLRPVPGTLGAVMWERVYDNLVTHGPDNLRAMTVDPASDVIAAGDTRTSNAGDWLIIKRAPNGKLRWIATYDGLRGEDLLSDVACDGAGNVYACGMSCQGATRSDFAVVKFRASDGKRLWRHFYAGPSGTLFDDWAAALTVDAAGNSYITGRSFDAAGTADILVMKLDPRGKRAWARRVDGPAHLADYGRQIALRGGIVYVAAQTSPEATAGKVWLLRYDTRGHRKWDRTWQDAPGTRSDLRDLAMDGAGNVVVAGNVTTGTPSSKGFLVSWSPSGQLRWSTTYWKTTTGEPATFRSIAVDAGGRIWAAGSIGTPGATEDALLVRYRPSGSVVWTQVFDGDEHRDDRFNVVALWGKSSLFAGGTLGTSAGVLDVLAAKYAR